VFDRKRLLRLYTPILLEQAVGTFVVLFGTVLVSGVSEATVSGVGLVGNLNMMVLGVFTSVATGATVMVSQYIGAGKPALAGRAAGQTMVVTTEAAAVAGLLMIVFARGILLALFGRAEADVLEVAREHDHQ